jgi:hypothetical protein
MDAWIYVVLLGGFIICMAWMKPQKKDQSSNQQLELILDQFIEDMEEENKKWVARLEEMRSNWEKETSHLKERLALLEALAAHAGPTQTFIQKPDEIAVGKMDAVPEEAVQENIEEPKIHLNLEQRYKEVFEWVKKGKSVPYIAKKTGMNHGEIELILQLAKQGEGYES